MILLQLEAGRRRWELGVDLGLTSLADRDTVILPGY